MEILPDMWFIMIGRKCDLCKKRKPKVLARIYFRNMSRLTAKQSYFKRAYTIRICVKCAKNIKKRSQMTGQSIFRRRRNM